MTKTRFFSVLLVVSFLFVLLPATVKAALWEIPVDLNPGDTFRWVFVTSALTDATSDDIGYYNTFVDTVADAADGPTTNLAGIDNWADIQWMAIASTEEMDAIENIGRSEGPIYNPVGDLIEVSTSAMTDGEILSPIGISEYGNRPPGVRVWTGSSIDLTGEVGRTMGKPMVTTGLFVAAFDIWINEFPNNRDWHWHLYAISEELTVVPEPGTLILGVTGMLSATVGLKRLRRKHQE